MTEMLSIPNMEVIAQAKGGVEMFRGMLADFPPHIIAQAAAYAIHKKVQDATGGAEMTGDERNAAGAACIAALKTGTWAKRGGGARITDAEDYVRREAKKAAELRIKKEPALATRGLETIIAAYIKAKGDAWRAEFAAKQAAREVDIEI
jgi:hypothetical protein